MMTMPGFQGISMLAQRLQWNESLTLLNLSHNRLLTRTLNVSQNPRDLQASNLNLRGNRITQRRVCEFDAKYPKLESWYRRERFDQEEVAGHTLTLLKIIRSWVEDGLTGNDYQRRQCTQIFSISRT
jgi:hypothetical protein